MKWLKIIIPVIIIATLIVAIVLARNAQAATLYDLGRKQAETIKIKSKLAITVEEKANLVTKVQKLEVENADLKAKRQAKLEAEKQAQVQRQSTPTVSRQSVPVSGSCSEWLASAGVTDTNNATYLINKESGCNPNAVNRSSGACGVAQELPCGKSGCNLGDGACQTAWMQQYVLGRYGSWAGAVAHSQAVGWY